jgi:hypothetical protein
MKSTPIQNRSRKIVRFLASLKLAVVIIIALAILTSVGTFVEAEYRAEIAKKLVYDSIWMYLVLGALSVSLTAVMVDRWPWQKRHTPFILAHIGILILLLGSLVTQRFGIDGSMRIGIGESNQFVVIPQTDLQIWSSFDGDRYSKIIGQEVDFYLQPPGKKTYSYNMAEGPLEIIDYRPFALPSKRVQAATADKAGAAVRIQIRNSNVNVTEWLVQKKSGSSISQVFGLMEVILGEEPAQIPPQNILVLKPVSAEELQYKIFFRDGNRKPMSGRLKVGDSIKPGWMDLEIRVVNYFQHAEETWEFRPLAKPTDLTTAAILVRFQERERWVQLNDVLKFFTENGVYILTFGNRNLDLGFAVQMKKFEVGRYQGTNRAASYQSLVSVPGIEDHLISMNEPLKHGGFTLYQASFQEGPMGEPIASILSVNYDPGRWIKYLGSLIICLGVIALFYQKRRTARAQAPRVGGLDS